MKLYSKIFLLPLAMLMVSACKEEMTDGSDESLDKNVTFVIGNDEMPSKAGMQIASYPIKGEGGCPDLILQETVSSLDGAGETAPGTKGAPVYTENFSTRYGSQLYATAFEPKASGKLTDVWGSYLENGGTVKLKQDEAPNTYYYDYSRGQSVNLAWPDDGQLLFFLQAPYDRTSALSPEFHAPGSIEFDYTDPTAPTDVEGRPTIVNGAAAQADILFTSKLISRPSGGAANRNNVLLYHALTAVKFKLGVVDAPAGRYATNISTDQYAAETKITKVTMKGLKANGRCTITPNYTDANTSAGSNPSNAEGAAASKSKSCSLWGPHSNDDALVVDYTQSFAGTVDYSGSNSDFAESFYDGSSNISNLGATTDGSEILLLIPQENSQAEFVIDFELISGSTVREYRRSVKVNVNWKAGELHTYELTVNKVEVDITDTMDDRLMEKNAVVMKNTGNVTAYLRASYAIAWYYGYGDDAIIVAAYQGHGRFIGLPGTNWIEGEDGYFYYKNPVRPDQSSDYPLFTKFTAPTKTEEAPFPGAHLEVKLLLQGVQYDENKVKVIDAWGTVKEKGKSTYVVDALGFVPENYGI